MREVYSMLYQSVSNSNVRQARWCTIDNKDVFLFTIQNSKGSRLVVSNFGAAAQSLIIKNAFTTEVDVLLGYSHPEGYSADSFYLGTVVGRCANRIAGAVVNIGKNAYRLTQKEGRGFHHHGGNFGFNKKVWQVTEVGPSNVRMVYKSADGEEGYPGEARVMVNYTFDEDNNWVVDYEAMTDKPTFINLTQHAYFNLAGHDSGSVLGHKLQIHAENYLPVNDLQVPTGEIAPVKNTPFDFRVMTPVGLRIGDGHRQLLLSNGYDHSWVLEEVHTRQLKHAATVLAPETGLVMDVLTTEPAVHFYSGNFLNHVPGKNGAVYKERSGFCLETQHFPDAPNHSHFPSIVLMPGEVLKSKTVFQFSVR